MHQPTETTWVSTKRLRADSWQELADSMAASAAWPDGASAFLYTESVDDCKLERCEARDLKHVIKCRRSDTATLLEGRIFDSQVEARWRRLTAARWAAWIIRELDGKPDAANHSSSGCSEEARRTLRRYYLLGTRDKTATHYHEARYAKRFEYPVQDARPNDRAYIEVAEYRRVEPEWSDLSAGGDAAIHDINNTLAQPPLFAHRFVRVGAGTGRKEG